MRFFQAEGYYPTLKGVLYNKVKRKAVFPFYASFKITSRCHFNCPFCNMHKNKTKDLSTEDIKRVLDNLSRSSVLLTSFEGGEPLLREDIFELLMYARSCSFYLLFTTSQKNIFDYQIEEYAPFIDFLHVSIDEGHNNLEMFDLLPELVKLQTQVSVQIVVTRDTVDSLEHKINHCYQAGANAVIIPAAPMSGAENWFPDIVQFGRVLKNLYKKYPNTIHTPHGYLKAFEKQKCSSASIIIDVDGSMYYPCHILETKGPDLRSIDLNSWLVTKEADEYRDTMKNCKLNCGWYQFYSIDSYVSPFTLFRSIKPMLFQHRKRPIN